MSRDAKVINLQCIHSRTHGHVTLSRDARIHVASDARMYSSFGYFVCELISQCISFPYLFYIMRLNVLRRCSFFLLKRGNLSICSRCYCIFQHFGHQNFTCFEFERFICKSINGEQFSRGLERRESTSQSNKLRFLTFKNDIQTFKSQFQKNNHF